MTPRRYGLFVSAEVACFAKPEGEPIGLRVQPRLASWMAAGHPDQARLAEFLAHAGELTGPRMASLADPIALRLEVGLPPAVDLLDAHDLDNYAFPLVHRLSKISGRRFASVWCGKRHAPTSLLWVEQAVPAGAAAPAGWQEVRTTASADTPEYKRQVHDQMAGQPALPGGPVSLQLSFAVGPRRNWPNLWKPTIDSLDGLLGPTVQGRPWHPRDGRIVELGLHCRTDAALGNDVVIAVCATPLPPESGTRA